MNPLQYTAFFISMSYVFYSMWWNFTENKRYYRKLFIRRVLAYNILSTLAFSIIGTLVDLYLFEFNLQTSVYFIPITFIISLLFFNLFSLLLNKRNFHSIREGNYFEGEKNISDVIITMLIIICAFIIPILTMSLINKNLHIY
jgi:hypothetical protein